MSSSREFTPGSNPAVSEVRRRRMSEATVPLNPEATGPLAAGSDARVVGPARILIIDDEAAIRESLDALLSMEGFSVTAAADGPAGLEQLAANEFDLLLLDLALPGESGIELLPRILEMQPDLPVIMITAYGTVSNVVDAIRAGAENFVQKPWDNEKLLADIRAAIGKRRAEEEVVQLKRALKQRYNFENIVGQERADAAAVRPGGAGGAKPVDGAGAGRKWNGQGTNRQGAACEFAAAGQAVCAGEHGRGAVGPAGIDAVRAREGRVYLGGRGEERPVRSGQWRHAVSGRDRHHGHGHAGEDTARAAGPALHASGRDAGDPGGRADYRGDQCGPACRRCARGASAKIFSTG